MSDRLAAAYAEPTVRHTLLVVAFAGLCYLFRGLFPLLLAGVATYELIAAIHRPLDRWMPSLSTRATHILTVLTLALLVSVGLWAGAGHLLGLAQEGWTSIPALMERALETPLWQKLLTNVPDAAVLLQYAKEYAVSHAASGFLVAKSVGHMIMLVTIGVIVAVIYAAEEERLERIYAHLSPTGPTATLWRWGSHIVAGLQAMVRTQFLVALVNAALTWPILYAMGFPNTVMLTLVVFVGSLIPVLGNLVVGVVLTILAGALHGASGAIGFLVVTYVLHKAEAYVINPRIAARYLDAPTCFMIAALIVWEYLVGLGGALIAFPSLIAAHRIRQECLPPVQRPDRAAP